MYAFLTEALKNRFITELRAYWAYHPKYPELTDNIQGKYSFKERPSTGIVLKTSSANQVQLSASNYIGLVESYVQLCKYENYAGQAVEWVREDSLATQKNHGVFPSPAGIYYLEIVASPLPSDENFHLFEPSCKHHFWVDPLLDVRNEVATKLTDFSYSTAHSYMDGTCRVYEMPGQIPYVRGVNFQENPDTNILTLTNPLPPKSYLSVDYRYPGETTGPWGIYENNANNKAIPGCVLAFGRRIVDKDKMAVVVHPYRQPCAEEYGGKWDIGVDFDVVARDPYAQQEISDKTILYLWGTLRNNLSGEGIEITNVSMGGESEESYDETGDDYFYNASFSIQTQTDWFIHVPLAATIRRVSPQTTAQIARTAALTPDQLVEADNLQNLTLLESVGLQGFTDPFFVGRNASFETIK